MNRGQEWGGARDWNARCAEFRWTNSASVVKYRSSTACGSSNSGGADRAGVGRMPIAAVVERLRFLGSLIVYMQRGEACGVS
jgi:hypothetical protein